MPLNKISDLISYLPACESPLSADVGVIRGEKCDWVFDAGCSDEAAAVISACGRPRNVILSHFHADHASNISRIPFETLYCSAYTADKLNRPAAIFPPQNLFDGIALRLFSLPPLHSKGAVGLEINGEYAFLGDAVYGSRKGGKTVYNVNTLCETIAMLRTISANEFLISHARPFLQPKEKVIASIEALYALRRPGEAYIPAE